MKWILFVAAIFAGYIISQLINMGIVLAIYSGNRQASIVFGIASVIALASGGLISGYVVGLISRRLKFAAGVGVGILVFAVTLVNLYLDMALEPVSHKLAVIFVMVPTIVIGTRFVAVNPPTIDAAQD